jgi:hypothetical protein
VTAPLTPVLLGFIPLHVGCAGILPVRNFFRQLIVLRELDIFYVRVVLCYRLALRTFSPCSLGLSATSQPYFSHIKPTISNQPAVLFSQNKPALAISHQPTEQAVLYVFSNR